MKCKDGGSYFYNDQKYRPLKIEKIIVNYFNSKNSNFSDMRFFRKCSMYRRSIPLKFHICLLQHRLLVNTRR